MDLLNCFENLLKRPIFGTKRLVLGGKLQRRERLKFSTTEVLICRLLQKFLQNAFLRKSYQKFTETYRSGHNGAVLKTVRVQAHGGSSPSVSAITSKSRTICPTFLLR